jgi:hypothetical protein
MARMAVITLALGLLQLITLTVVSAEQPLPQVLVPLASLKGQQMALQAK